MILNKYENDGNNVTKESLLSAFFVLSISIDDDVKSKKAFDILNKQNSNWNILEITKSGIDIISGYLNSDTLGIFASNILVEQCNENSLITLVS